MQNRRSGSLSPRGTRLGGMAEDGQRAARAITAFTARERARCDQAANQAARLPSQAAARLPLRLFGAFPGAVTGALFRRLNQHLPLVVDWSERVDTRRRTGCRTSSDCCRPARAGRAPSAAPPPLPHDRGWRRGRRGRQVRKAHVGRVPARGGRRHLRARRGHDPGRRRVRCRALAAEAGEDELGPPAPVAHTDAERVPATGAGGPVVERKRRDGAEL